MLSSGRSPPIALAYNACIVLPPLKPDERRIGTGWYVAAHGAQRLGVVNVHAVGARVRHEQAMAAGVERRQPRRQPELKGCAAPHRGHVVDDRVPIAFIDDEE